MAAPSSLLPASPLSPAAAPQPDTRSNLKSSRDYQNVHNKADIFLFPGIDWKYFNCSENRRLMTQQREPSKDK